MKIKKKKQTFRKKLFYNYKNFIQKQERKKNNMSENAEKRKALEVAMNQIEKQFGKGSVMKLGEFKAMEVEAIPTGALSLDIALGIGGVPRGRIVEVFGPESSGKTTLALHIIAEAQKMGGEAAFIDAEHALDPVYAKKLGVDIDNLIVSQPDTGEQALEITEALVRSGALFNSITTRYRRTSLRNNRSISKKWSIRCNSSRFCCSISTKS